jgi:hypothetical protein
MRHVILGDPGAGKTTLLKFMALFGQSEPLQQRFGAASEEGVTRFESDDRLPIFIRLRRYAIRTVFIPNLVDRIPSIDFNYWQATNDHFTAGTTTLADIYAASFQLIIDGLLFVTGYHDPDGYWLRGYLGYDDEMITEHATAASESRMLFASIADKTRDRKEAPLRIAHCIRDLAYGDETCIDNFEKMFLSNSPVYRSIFERSFWRPNNDALKRDPRNRK